MKHGFSLVELSIVLVILGLLVGGVMTGQNLIHAAELRKLSTQITEHRTALHVFRDKYFALPGDIRNATQFWGAADTSAGGECANPLTDVGSGSETCNGDGNGQIGSNEVYRVWQHLSNAGMLPGNYTGISGPDTGAGGQQDIIGENVPSTIRQGGFRLIYISQSSLDTYFSFNLSGGNYFRIAGCCNGTYNTIGPGFLSAEDTWNVDTKIDDGRPYHGFMQAQKGYWLNCTVTQAEDAEYDVSASGNDCSLVIRLE